MTTTKITKRMNYETISAVLSAAEAQGFTLPDGITYDSLDDFVAHEIELLDKKAEAAAKRAADKKVAGDALREKVLSQLTDEFQTIAEITNSLGDAQISPQMVTPRLTQLVDLKQAVKDTKTIAGVDGGKSRKVSVYKLA